VALGRFDVPVRVRVLDLPAKCLQMPLGSYKKRNETCADHRPMRDSEVGAKTVLSGGAVPARHNIISHKSFLSARRQAAAGQAATGIVAARACFL